MDQDDRPKRRFCPICQRFARVFPPDGQRPDHRSPGARPVIRRGRTTQRAVAAPQAAHRPAALSSPTSTRSCDKATRLRDRQQRCAAPCLIKIARMRSIMRASVTRAAAHAPARNAAQSAMIERYRAWSNRYVVCATRAAIDQQYWRVFSTSDVTILPRYDERGCGAAFIASQ